MAGWFRFKDVRSTDYGAYVSEYPAATIPEERVEFKPVPGRSGELTQLEGDAVYEDIILAFACYLADLSQRDLISAWLRGRGELELGNHPGRCYRARAVSQIELKKILRGRDARSFDAVFRCKPFQYEVDPEPYRFTRPTTIANEGTLPASPILRVQGTGNVVLTVGARSVALDNMAGTVTIDCEAMTAYHAGDTEARVSITLLDKGWPVLGLGDTRISWSGDVRLITMDANWCWL